MLTSSFIFVPGMSEEMERQLWKLGVTSWEILRKHRGVAADAIGESRTHKLLECVNEAQTALAAGNAAWFGPDHWPVKETWRLWRGYCEPAQMALVDIETTGRTPGFDQITVIGISDGTNDRAFVADVPQAGDHPLAAFPEDLAQHRLLVTFNGVSFDVPFIEQHFRHRGLKIELPHLDLIHPARNLGLHGGLKDMEKEVGIIRAHEISEMRGDQAITLWGAWKRGDLAAYRKLVAYCKADCRNLCEFAEIIYRRKWDEVYTPYARDTDLDAEMGEQLSLFC